MRVCFLCFGFGFALMLSARAEDSGALFLYGSTKYESRSELGTGGKVIVIDHIPTGCEEIAWQAKLVLDQSEAWISHRRSGVRRIAAQDLIFFQYTGLRFHLPYEKGDKDALSFYDPFELLGYLHFRWKSADCAKKKPPHFPAWPFGVQEWTKEEAAITFTGMSKGRRLYVESFQGYATDVYYCKKTMSAEDLGKLRHMLLGVKASRRIEDSNSFREYTAAREAICGEN